MGSRSLRCLRRDVRAGRWTWQSPRRIRHLRGLPEGRSLRVGLCDVLRRSEGPYGLDCRQLSGLQALRADGLQRAICRRSTGATMADDLSTVVAVGTWLMMDRSRAKLSCSPVLRSSQFSAVGSRTIRRGDFVLDESTPVPQTDDGLVYSIGATSGGEFPSIADAIAWADQQPWGPVKWVMLPKSHIAAPGPKRTPCVSPVNRPSALAAGLPDPNRCGLSSLSRAKSARGNFKCG